MEINEFEIRSVGVDVGSSTSHLVFSNLLLKRDETSKTRRFRIEDRTVIYEGRIINTPLLDDRTLDVDRLAAFFREEYQRAGIDPGDIQSGAVIVTGESAKKENAADIAAALSSDAGKFVAATAGPNFESMLSAMGSGATSRSQQNGHTILTCDIGGGTSNIAIVQKGEIIATSCISVGGRLVGIKSDGTIWRIDEPARKVMDHLNLSYQIGDKMPPEDKMTIARQMIDILVEALSGPVASALGRQLMLTNDPDFPSRIDEYSFSGGVAELMYGGVNNYGDIGHLLADELNLRIPQLHVPVVESASKIRATVIGAGAYSLSISGCSGFMDERISFPIRNVPVLRVDVEQSQLSPGHVATEIKKAFGRFDYEEGQEVVALYFEDPVQASYPKMELFSRSIEMALPNSIKNKRPIILIFKTDIACGVGNVMRRETNLKNNLLSLDELSLREGDWIDIGEPLVDGQVFPVTVKSLVFYDN
jgi:ethanolamine utilization protein EutA